MQVPVPQQRVSSFLMDYLILMVLLHLRYCGAATLPAG